MKKLLPVIFTIIISAQMNAQIVNIPDANFKAYLVGNVSINTNMDTEIQLSEATAFTGQINCPSLGILDLTGIEAFTSLTELYCYTNQLTALDVSNNTLLTNLDCGDNVLTTLDVSSNTALTDLNCKWNQLTTLDVSNNALLTYLDCGGNVLTSVDVSTASITNLLCPNNQLTSLDVSSNTALSYLNCQTNQLTTLDLSNNTALITLNCMFNQLTALNNMSGTVTILQATYNQLTSIDVSNNTALTVLGGGDNLLISLNVKNGNNTNMSSGFFATNNNPGLTCIEVDNAAYSTVNWTYIDASASFSEDCNAGIENNELVAVSIYPNPTSDILNVNSLEKVENIRVYNELGEMILNTNQTQFSVYTFSPGLYIVEIKTDSMITYKKFIKQ